MLMLNNEWFYISQSHYKQHLLN